ncbi:hypothetical protein C4E24_04965 [ANME-1 cluster archaeon AG-394-G21]|nr:hypothetical protein [ANME-1 cluster archaeon AG-394-G21]
MHIINGSFLGAILLKFHIKKHYKWNMLHNKIHQHLLEVGLARPNLKKQKKRQSLWADQLRIRRERQFLFVF